MRSNERAIEEWAVALHGAGGLLHAVMLAHNIRRRNALDVGFHLLAVGYEILAVSRHVKSLKRQTEERQ